ncbi:MAG: hypothetical protein HC914_17275 [Chloroflexaceae bacterium]|nr:hypothetical protein [Chloroflexaceae bacterium]
MYLRARWYDPASGTFLSRDPFAGFAQQPYSQHPYQYAYSNPARWTDPSGNQVQCNDYPNQWPFEWQSICRRANQNLPKGDPDYADMIDAREELDQALANTALLKCCVYH